MEKSKHCSWTSQLPKEAIKGMVNTNTDTLLKLINRNSPKAPRGGNLWLRHKRYRSKSGFNTRIRCACYGEWTPKDKGRAANARTRVTRTQKSSCTAAFTIIETLHQSGVCVRVDIYTSTCNLQHSGHPNMDNLIPANKLHGVSLDGRVYLTSDDRAALNRQLKGLGEQIGRPLARPIVEQYLQKHYGEGAYIVNKALDYLITTARECAEREALQQVIPEGGLKGLSDSQKLYLRLQAFAKKDRGRYLCVDFLAHCSCRVVLPSHVPRVIFIVIYLVQGFVSYYM